MKIILFSRQRVNHRPLDLRQIFDSIDGLGFDYCVNEEFVESIKELIGRVIPEDKIYGAEVGVQPEGSVMVCYGGDGTILEGLHRLGGQPIKVSGINSGRLGFLSTVSCDGIGELFERIAANTLHADARTMIALEGDFLDEGRQLFAANEFSVQRHGASMIAVDTYVDGQMVATYHGDGVIVSTPTGSTAYSLSAGGPILTPQCASWVISPLAPHNITMRPMVLPDSSVIEMVIRVREGEAFISMDNRTYMVGKGARVRIMRAERSFFLALPGNISFYETLRNKMMWGVDIRG